MLRNRFTEKMVAKTLSNIPMTNKAMPIKSSASLFIMACNLKRGEDQHIPLETMDGSRESLEKCLALGADGVLLNRIEMALEWRKNL